MFDIPYFGSSCSVSSSTTVLLALLVFSSALDLTRWFFFHYGALFSSTVLCVAWHLAWWDQLPWLDNLCGVVQWSWSFRPHRRFGPRMRWTLMTGMLRIIMLGLALLSLLLLTLAQRCAPCVWHRRCGIIYEVITNIPIMHGLMLYLKLCLQLIRASALSKNSITIYRISDAWRPPWRSISLHLHGLSMCPWVRHISDQDRHYLLMHLSPEFELLHGHLL